MASTFGTANFVQNSYADNWTEGYPGQLVNVSDYSNGSLRTFPSEENIIMGRGVVKATLQNSGEAIANVSTAPFTVKLPIVTSVAADLVGIAIRPFVTTTNILESGENKAGYLAKDNIALLPFDSHREIWVEVLIGVTIVAGETVHISIVPGTSLVPFGAFTNTAAGAIVVPNAIWYTNKTATANNRIAVIKLGG